MHDISPADIRRKRESWLDEALSLIPNDVIRAEAVRDFQPRLKRCNARTKSRFWNWLRLQCAKTEYDSLLLEWCRESKCAPEVVKPTQGFEYSISADGSTALVDVHDDENNAVWRVPIERLDWALSLCPVSLKKIPATESPLAKTVRQLQRQLARNGWQMTREQKQQVKERLTDVQLAQLRESSEGNTRFMLVKYIGGEQLLVHRLFCDAGRDDVIDAVDGDFLNFGITKIKITVEAVGDNGLRVRKGSSPLSETSEVLVPNLQIVNSSTEQGKFEQAFLQQKFNSWDEPDESPLKVLPNSTWATGFYGRVEDAGGHRPVMMREAVEMGIQHDLEVESGDAGDSNE
jgi:hypothetical protein